MNRDILQKLFIFFTCTSQTASCDERQQQTKPFQTEIQIQYSPE